MSDTFDLLIVGGGINGAGLARDAAGRGLKVCLVEQDDLAAHTSSWSSKLVHGGLRYLEQYEFRLVREALLERERLMAIAPHLVTPLRFIIPHDRSVRPAWLVRLGLFMYDHLAPRKFLPGCERVDLSRDPRAAPLVAHSDVAFAYSDCAVDDSRLVVLNALDAKERGADIRTGVALQSARRGDGIWHARLNAAATGEVREVTARILINAAGPWVAEVLNQRLGINAQKHVRLIKGSHIVVPRMYEGDHAYVLQNADKRIVFVIPYRGRFTLIGTTDVPYRGEPRDAGISTEETSYLIDTVNHWMKSKLSAEAIVWTYSGVRPLFDDGAIEASTVTRDYVFDLDNDGGAAPILSIFGGKITTYRRLAEHAMGELARFLPSMRQAWTASAPLPGGDVPNGGMEAFVSGLRTKYPFLENALATRLAYTYGTRAAHFLRDARSMADLGRDFGAGLTAAEVDYLAAKEWASTGSAILWRRTKLGLELPASAGGALDEYLGARLN